MIDILRRLFGFDRRAKLERHVRLAAEMDELLMAGKITPELRQKLNTAREDLEPRIRELLTVHPFDSQ